MSAPTILLSAPYGVAARFLLRTAVVPRLLDAGVKVVVLVPNPDEEYLRAEFDDPRITLELLRTGTQPPADRLWLATTTLRGTVLADGHRNRTIRAKLANAAAGLAQQGRLGRLAAAALRVTVPAFWRSRTLRRGLLALETRFRSPDPHADVFERHRPRLVVTTSPGWFLADAVVLREARRRGIPSVAAVLGWDNPTSKGYRGADPETIVAWSQHMADQVAALHDFPRERVQATGVPHFDLYRRPGQLLDRETLFARFGLDPARKLVVFATSTPSGLGDNTAVARSIEEAIASGTLGDAQLVVRVHPFYFRTGEDTGIGSLRALAERCEHVTLDVPEILSLRMRSDVPHSDDVRLGSLLAHCDVLVNVFSTTTVEAFLLDRPVVFVGGWQRPDRPGGPDPRDYAGYTHLRGLIEAGAVRVAADPAALVEHIRSYLDDPSLERDLRLRFAQREAGPADGHAGDRLADLILAAAGTRAPAPAPSGTV
ncbi:CDP-glycerol glycerophosphotransferase family protein [Solirubrobacter ginsenosidimutans]|uniref:CDP-glycerol glycerophosphotransferase family protein n=1 Tax=Solirubrobacter ginsenosidimutans TaxID=490573 RepID=A0A9X3MY95_9ACTN|nr:hypothetical protein [Solirubrobacter ginsenosidimutans]MDA0164757.1 CDP-glycerol glycerophosphotransferase family protein [Solirubrobacter ginsenosidimutans]